MDYPFSILNDPLESMTLKTFPDWACRIIWIIELSVKLPICHFYSHFALMGPRTGLWRTLTLLTSFRSKIKRKKIQQLLVVTWLWTFSFRFPSQPIRSSCFVEFYSFYLFQAANSSHEFRFKNRSELLVETWLCSLTNVKHVVRWTLSDYLGYPWGFQQLRIFWTFSPAAVLSGTFLSGTYTVYWRILNNLEHLV